MKPALFWKPLEGKSVSSIRCELCPHLCTISPGSSGLCGARKNIDGKLFSLNYARPISIAIDPIEKKPLFHFLPGSKVLSLGTYGCNLSCQNCQNFDISMVRDRQPKEEHSPDEIVQLALDNGCSAVAYTYNEPTIFYEYMLDCAKLARKSGLKNIMVSNGYINPEPLAKLLRYIDAANIDLKSFRPDFYKQICKGTLQPVKDTLLAIRKSKAWLEVTTLIIPEENDSPKEIEALSGWVAESLGRDVPLHLSRFFPLNQLSGRQPTPEKTLLAAREIASHNLNYVYVGNISLGYENTLCPSCKSIAVKRQGYSISANKIKKGRCSLCGAKLQGFWE